MTDKELKKLSRAELLQMLILQIKENETLSRQLADAQSQLQERQISVDKAGSIAEAALQLNGVFEAAEAAGQQYIENIRQLSERQQTICEQLEKESREKAEKRLAEAEEKSRLLEVETKKRCDEMTTKAKEESGAYWEETSRRLQAFSKEHSELMELLSNPLLKRK